MCGMRVRMYTYHVYTYYVYLCVPMCTYVYIWVHVCTCDIMCTHVYTCACTHTHIHVGNHEHVSCSSFGCVSPYVWFSYLQMHSTSFPLRFCRLATQLFDVEREAEE